MPKNIAKKSKKTQIPQFANTFDQLQHRMDRAFSDFSLGFHWPEIFSSGDVDVVPTMEIVYGDSKVTMSVELPGVEEKEIDISVVDQNVTVSGEKTSESEVKEGDGFRSERSYGSFSRSVTLPFRINPDAVAADFKKGVLTLTIAKPKEAQEKAKKIAINS